jgi:hypothetical protein
VEKGFYAVIGLPCGEMAQAKKPPRQIPIPIGLRPSGN